MKRIVALLAVIAVCLSGCYDQIDDDDRELVVYASFFPIFSFLEQITQDVPLLDVKCLTQPLNGCLRSYELSYWDMAKLSVADAIVVGGRGLESFEDLLEGAGLAVVEVMQTSSLLGDKEEVVEGDDEASHFAGENPWAWLSVDEAKDICESIAAAMAQIDPKYADIYAANLDIVSHRLDELKASMASVMPNGSYSVAVMQEGMEYIARDLGLSVVATIERESGEDMDDESADEAVEMIKNSGANAVLIEKQASASLVRRLEDGGTSVALIDTYAYAPSDGDYCDVMLENALAVAAALKNEREGL